jgi:hypothetical protein
MVSPRGIAQRYADQVKLRLIGRRYLTEEQERALYLEALDMGLSFEEAREVLVMTAAQNGAARETTLDHDIETTIAAVAGDRGWISRTAFDRAAGLYQQRSGGAVGAGEAKGRVKAIMLRQGWTIRGATIFGTPHWFRIITAADVTSAASR